MSYNSKTDIVEKILEEIIKHFTTECWECKTLRFKSDLIDVEACADGDCCYKSVCKDGCIFKLDCGCEIRIDPYELDEPSISLECECDKIHTLKLRWWGMTRGEHKRRYGY